MIQMPDIPKLPILNPLTHSDLVKDELSKGLKFNTSHTSDNRPNPLLVSSSALLGSNKHGGSGDDIRITNSQYNKIVRKSLVIQTNIKTMPKKNWTAGKKSTL